LDVNIPIPKDYLPRLYQLDFIEAIEKYGYKRAIQVWHRRGGKDITDLAITLRSCLSDTGVYWHVFPTYSQGKKAMWEGVTKDGKRYLDFIPKETIKRINNQEMLIEFNNDSIWRVVGSDNVNNLVGAGVRGVVFSEASLQSPLSWQYIQPMLLENNGWAIFNGTPRGENHFYELVEMAKENKNWYVDIKTIEDTNVVTPAQIEELRREGKPEEIIQQEYYCSFAGSIHGAYYADMMNKMAKEGRICSVPVDNNVLVNTAWDLGINDAMAITFYQTVGKEIHIIDYYEASGHGFAHYAAMLAQKGYNYGKHYAPHDIKARELGTGKSRLEVAQSMGIRFEIAPSIPRIDGIGAVRGLLSRVWIDKEKGKHLINCLKQYRKDWDEKGQRFRDHPLHDWSSNGADSFRYLCVSYKEKLIKTQSHFVLKSGFKL
jgi:hypothetical protein